MGFDYTRAFDKATNVFRVPDEEYGADIGEIEIIKFDFANKSGRLKKAKAKKISEIKKGLSRTEAWNNYFCLPSRQSKKIVIADRYLGAPNHIAGFDFFLKRLLETPGPEKTIEIYIAHGYESNGKIQTEDMIEERFRMAINKLDYESHNAILKKCLLFSDKNSFGQKFHHRFIQFGGKMVFQSDNGLEPLEEQAVGRSNPITYREIFKTERKGVRQLRAKSNGVDLTNV